MFTILLWELLGNHSFSSWQRVPQTISQRRSWSSTGSTIPLVLRLALISTNNFYTGHIIYDTCLTNPFVVFLFYFLFSFKLLDFIIKFFIEILFLFSYLLTGHYGCGWYVGFRSRQPIWSASHFGLDIKFFISYKLIFLPHKF